MKEFRIGALVIAVTVNPDKVKGSHPEGDATRYGDCGALIGGPVYAYNGPTPRTHWQVEWVDGRRTWSTQEALMVIGDKDPGESFEQALDRAECLQAG